MTQAVVAAQLGITQQSVSQWERGVAIPGQEHQDNLEDLLDWPRGALGGTDSNQNQKGTEPPFLRVVPEEGSTVRIAATASRTTGSLTTPILHTREDSLVERFFDSVLERVKLGPLSDEEVGFLREVGVSLGAVGTGPHTDSETGQRE